MFLCTTWPVSTSWATEETVRFSW